MTKARRILARLLAKAAVRISPEPPMGITVKRVVEIDPKIIADAITGSTARGLTVMPRGDDGLYRY